MKWLTTIPLLLASTLVGAQTERYNMIRLFDDNSNVATFYGCMIEINASGQRLDFVSVCNGVDFEKIKIGSTYSNVPMYLTISTKEHKLIGKKCRLISTSTGGNGSIFDFDCRTPTI